MSGNWSELGLSQVSDRLRDVEAQVAAMMEEYPTALEAIVRLDREMGEVHQQRRENSRSAAASDERVRDLAVVVNRLATQVAWLEQQVRVGTGAQPVDLDRVEPELRGLADTVEAGRAASEGLLGTFERATFDATLVEHKEALEAYRAGLEHLLAGARELADADPDADGYLQLRSAYRAARTTVLTSQRRLEELAVVVSAARAALEADEQQREEQRVTIAAGEAAEVELMTRLRTRVAQALADGALMPVWLTTLLGPMPPAGAGQRWTEIAARLIAYRITYRVEGADTFGEVGPSAPEGRRKRYEEIQQAVRTLHV